MAKDDELRYILIKGHQAILGDFAWKRWNVNARAAKARYLTELEFVPSVEDSILTLPVIDWDLSQRTKLLNRVFLHQERTSLVRLDFIRLLQVLTDQPC